MLLFYCSFKVVFLIIYNFQCYCYGFIAPSSQRSSYCHRCHPKTQTQDHHTFLFFGPQREKWLSKIKRFKRMFLKIVKFVKIYKKDFSCLNEDFILNFGLVVILIYSVPNYNLTKLYLINLYFVINLKNNVKPPMHRRAYFHNSVVTSN